MHDEFEDEIRELLESGNTFAAVKAYREETSVGLAETRTAVEAMEGRRLRPPDTADPSSCSRPVPAPEVAGNQ